MAERQPKKRVINLLPNKGETILNDFLSWSLSIGRLLVIITEMLALGVFLYRFSLDMQIVDLHDKIKQDSAIVSDFKEGEATYRDLQTKLASIKQYNAIANRPTDIFKAVIALGRGRVTFNSINVTNKSIDLEVQAQSSNAIFVFTQALTNYSQVQNVTINSVENKTSTGVVIVGISAKLKPISKT